MKGIVTVIAWLFFVGTAAGAGQAPPMVDSIVTSCLVRPSTDALCKYVRSGSMVMSVHCTSELYRIIRELDQAHLELLNDAAVTIAPVADTTSWIREASRSCPSRTPQYERAVYAALHLQLVMLDRVLMEVDRTMADKLRVGRKKIRIRGKQDHFFGDVRDEYTSRLLIVMEHISRVQEALGARGKTDWIFPKDAERNQSRMEAFVIEKIKWIQHRSNRLLAYERTDRP